MPRTQRKELQPITRTGRWLHAGIGAGAAIATILASAHSCGLLGAEGSRISVTNLAVHWIGLTPAVDTAESLGDTLRFVATVTDRRGATLVGATLLWETEDTTVATVDSAGFVVARNPGTTTVVSRAGERIARARVVVRPRVARLELDLDSLVATEGSEHGITGEAFDGRRNRLAWRQPAFTSGDTSLVRIRESRLTAIAPGRVMVTALIDGSSDSMLVVVTPVPGRLVLLRGDGQRALAGQRLSEPVVIRVEARSGRPIPGMLVRFASSGQDSIVTDEGGLARIVWTLGESPGRQKLTASVAGLDSAMVLEAEAEPQAANTRVVPLDDSLRGITGGPPITTGIRLTDSLGRTLPGVPVRWSALDRGRVEARGERTDSMGELRVEWKLGPRSGTQRLRAVVGTGRAVPPRTITALALPGDPKRLELAAPAPKQAAAGTTLGRPLLIRVTDEAGNRIPEVPLSFAPAAGEISESTTVTDSLGRASVRWTLGHAAGIQRLTITAAKLQPLIVSVEATPGPVANLALTGLPAAAPAGKPLGKPVRVSVTDVYGNPVPNQLVVMQASSGSVNPSRAMTDRSGTANTTWILGSRPGVQRLTASAPKSSVKQTVEIEALGRR